jgi:ribonuclease-3
MEKLEANLKYTFKNKELLKNALTHSSYANEKKGGASSNERLEFLGDSVLSVIASNYLFENFPELPEGNLTKLRASLVCEKSLCEFSKKLEIGEYLLLGKGEKANGGSTRPSILADAFEAVLAAMYLDGGMNVAKEHVLRFISEELSHLEHENFKDYKTELQEIIQKNPEEKLTYRLIEESGPDHNKNFVVEVHLNSNVIGKGSGHSKKKAEQMAARQALELMGIKL